MLKDSQDNPINPGNTLEVLEDGRACYKGDKFTVALQKWEDDDPKESLVAVSTPNPFLAVLLTKDRAREYKVV